MDAIKMSFFRLDDVISDKIGVQAIAVRFVLSLLVAYPLGYMYRGLIQSQKPIYQHIYFTLCGLSLLYFCFGWKCLHSLVNILLAYVVLRIGGPCSATVLLSFLLNMGYLMVAYYERVFDEFMLDWSVPHCVLCLRLTGIAWDYYDGNNYNNNEISEDLKTTRIFNPPTLFEMTGFCYVFGAFMVGPQFPIRRYLALVDGTIQDRTIDNRLSISAGLQRLFLGIVYLVVHMVLSPSFKADYLLSEWFENISYLRKLWFITWYSKVLWMKYLSMFLISEGSCIVTGLGYNGMAENGKPKWNGVTNVQVVDYETSYSVHQVIKAFHLTTSLWVVRYVYKRLKFLGNKFLSMAISQVFLAVWHGFCPGYYLLFLCQFLWLAVEKTISNTWESFGCRKISKFPIYIQMIIIPALYLLKQFMLGYGSVPLTLLEFNKIHKVGLQTFYAPLIVVLAWIALIYPFIVLPVIKSRMCLKTKTN